MGESSPTLFHEGNTRKGASNASSEAIPLPRYNYWPCLKITRWGVHVRELTPSIWVAIAKGSLSLHNRYLLGFKYILTISI